MTSYRGLAATIAGSDSGGGAGIQADLKTFAALDVFGTTVITALTAQNSLGVEAIFDIPPSMIRAQIDALWSDFPIGATKTGMLPAPKRSGRAPRACAAGTSLLSWWIPSWWRKAAHP
jgi:hydroxymethylpyrimidine/phosphomethylpyrimidine kinase